MMIRTETAGDHSQVRQVHLTSFPDATEADLVKQLRADGDAVLSLVAIDDGKVVGHVMFSRLSAPFKALCLAPVAVLPEWRKRGIAARLIEEGIRQAANTGWDGVFVVGDPAYYERFGFAAAQAAAFESQYAGPYLMALALQEKDLPAQSGKIEFAPAFAGLK